METFAVRRVPASYTPRAAYLLTHLQASGDEKSCRASIRLVEDEAAYQSMKRHLSAELNANGGSRRFARRDAYIPGVNEMVAVKFADQWSRAIVRSVIAVAEADAVPFASDAGQVSVPVPCDVKVCLVDEGSESIVNCSRLAPLPHAFTKDPMYAITVHICTHELPVVQRGFNETFQQVFQFKFMDELRPGEYAVEFCRDSESQHDEAVLGDSQSVAKTAQLHSRRVHPSELINLDFGHKHTQEILQRAISHLAAKTIHNIPCGESPLAGLVELRKPPGDDSLNGGLKQSDAVPKTSDVSGPDSETDNCDERRGRCRSAAGGSPVPKECAVGARNEVQPTMDLAYTLKPEANTQHCSIGDNGQYENEWLNTELDIPPFPLEVSSAEPLAQLKHTEAQPPSDCASESCLQSPSFFANEHNTPLNVVERACSSSSTGALGRDSEDESHSTDLTSLGGGGVSSPMGMCQTPSPPLALRTPSLTFPTPSLPALSTPSLCPASALKCPPLLQCLTPSLLTSLSCPSTSLEKHAEPLTPLLKCPTPTPLLCPTSPLKCPTPTPVQCPTPSLLTSPSNPTPLAFATSTPLEVYGTPSTLTSSTSPSAELCPTSWPLETSSMLGCPTPWLTSLSPETPSPGTNLCPSLSVPMWQPSSSPTPSRPRFTPPLSDVDGISRGRGQFCATGVPTIIRPPSPRFVLIGQNDVQAVPAAPQRFRGPLLSLIPHATTLRHKGVGRGTTTNSLDVLYRDMRRRCSASTSGGPAPSLRHDTPAVAVDKIVAKTRFGRLDFGAGKEYPVENTFSVRDPHDFVLQLKAFTHKLTAYYQEFYQNNTDAIPTIALPAPKCTCCMYRTKTESGGVLWARVEIVRSNSDDATVLLVDYGHVEKVERRQCRRLKAILQSMDDLVNVPALAAVCRLADVRPAVTSTQLDDDSKDAFVGWGEAQREYFKSLCRDSTVTFGRRCGADIMARVSLKTANGDDVGGLLARRGLCQFIYDAAARDTPPDDPSVSQRQNEGSDNVSSCGVSRQSNSLLTVASSDNASEVEGDTLSVGRHGNFGVETDEKPSKADSVLVEYRRPRLYDRCPLTELPVVWPVCDTKRAIVLNIRADDLGFAVHLAEHEKMYTALREALKKCQSDGANVAVAEWRPGMLCWVRHSTGELLRGWITKELDGDQFLVDLVDVGETSVRLRSDALHYLDESTAVAAFPHRLAVPLFLSSVLQRKPGGGMKEYNVDEIQRWNELLSRKIVDVTLDGSDGDGKRWCSIRFHDRHHGKDYCLNQVINKSQRYP